MCIRDRHQRGDGDLHGLTGVKLALIGVAVILREAHLRVVHERGDLLRADLVADREPVSYTHLSKRHGDPSYEDLKAQGFLTPAILNYVALLDVYKRQVYTCVPQEEPRRPPPPHREPPPREPPRDTPPPPPNGGGPESDGGAFREEMCIRDRITARSRV